MEQVIASADDPWYWNTDQLVNHICRSPSLFRGAGKPDTLPDAAALETRLRERVITGDGFLTALDLNGLHSYLGIQSLSERLSLFAVIEFMREKSDGYKQHAAAATVQGLTHGNANAPSSLKTRVAPTNAATTHANVRKRQEPVQVDMERPTASGSQPLTEGFGIDGGQPQVNGGGQWDHLMHWDQGEAATIGVDELAYYDDGYSDEAEEEGQYMGGGAAGKASPKPSDSERDADQVQEPSNLSQDQIVEIINERIEHYTDEWEPNSGVPKGEEIEYNLVAMWEDAEGSGRRPRLIQMYEAEIAYYTQRLDELCDQIMKVPGRTADQVRQQCRNLEVTINSKLLSEWLLSVYQSEAAGSDDDEEGSQPGSSMAGTGPDVFAHQPDNAVTHEVIDLGSPSASSEDEPEEILVDSSPQPELPINYHELSSTARFHTPDSVFGDAEVDDTVEFRLDVPTPMPPTPRTAPSSLPPPQLNDAPELASIGSARRWTWTQLVETMDRKRIVTKALSSMPPTNLETIRTRLAIVGRTDMMREIPACIHMFANHETKISGVLARDMDKIIPFTRLFLCWWLCDDYFRLEPGSAPLHEVLDALQRGTADSRTFCEYVGKVMSTTFSKDALRHPEQPSQAEIITISDDEEEEEEEETTPARIINRRIGRRERGDVIMLD